MKIIDPHVHFFDLEKGDYAWLKPENPPFWPDKAKIHQNFSPSDLRLSKNLSLSGFVHIEAGFDNENPWQEIQWLEKQATRNPAFSFKSIACINLLQSPQSFLATLTRLKQFKSVVGARHILDNAAQIQTEKNVILNFKQLADFGLLFEAQFDVSDTEQALIWLHLAKSFPTLRMVLNHAGFPPREQSQKWKNNIHALSAIPSLWVKASGWEMSDRHYPNHAILKQVKCLLEAFGEQRVMLASNFPLTLFRRPYACLWDEYLAMTLPKETLEKLCYQNAKKCYQF